MNEGVLEADRPMSLSKARRAISDALLHNGALKASGSQRHRVGAPSTRPRTRPTRTTRAHRPMV